MSFSLFELILAMGLAVGGTALGLSVWSRPRAKLPLGPYDDPLSSSDVAFLFHGTELIEVSKPARAILDQHQGPGSSWDIAVTYCDGVVPGASALLSQSPSDTEERVLPHPTRDDVQLRIKPHLGLVCIVIEENVMDAKTAEIPQITLNMLTRELTLLQDLSRLSPVPIWRCDPAGDVIWSNAAYQDLDPKGEAPGPAPLFAVPESDKPIQVYGAKGPDDPWFRIEQRPVANGTLHYAIPAAPQIKAERSHAALIRRMSQTFAALSAGLAVFNADRQIILFNPALCTLTNLRAEWLALRPSLGDFLDKLRDLRMIPEPKDYESWRSNWDQTVARVESGTWQEDWSLHNGMTLRVTSRATSDSGFVLVLEDATEEVSALRLHRQDSDVWQDVLDLTAGTVAVFSREGLLFYSTLTDIWDLPDAQTFDIIEATRHWSSLCHPSPAWGDLREFVLSLEARSDWSAPLQRTTGDEVELSVHPLRGGFTLVQLIPIPRPILNTDAVGKVQGRSVRFDLSASGSGDQARQALAVQSPRAIPLDHGTPDTDPPDPHPPHG